jgi:polyisoprenyl-phosphate glycosyltransferase
VLATLAIAYAGFILVAKLLGNVDVPGYASLMVTVLLLGALNLISLGILGEYIGRISTEVRGRPLYIVEHTFGIEASDLSKVSRG